ncbi:MAG: EVE domain-containing protein [candidate division SR1 bacterium]|nr:EVE domain-containing protein [candidate division SR1 bacterium]
MTNYFLAKTEPSAFSIDDLEREGITKWDGVHSHQAINFIKNWKIGDKVFIYHSTGHSSIVGLGEVVSKPEKDTNDERNISWFAKVKFVCKYPEGKYISLKQVKESGKFNDFYLVKQSRLSVMECPDNFVSWLKYKGLSII